ncbi:hypothetical protein BYT27DRAFT_7265331 [Phlegmacium glaucopus]|nr:hypothetical protein BYT27DRAFT_7265331 [Phlegmacium glaucopus]
MELTPGDFDFIGRCLEGFFYGIYSGIFAMYLQHWSSQKGNCRTKKIIFYALCTLYVLTVAIVVGDVIYFIYSFDGNLATATLHISFIENTVIGFCDFIAQSILIYRCWIVWGCNFRVVILPSILTVTFLAMWLVGGFAEYNVLDKIVQTVWGSWMTMAGVAISMTVNALMTGLIVFKIFNVSRTVKSTLPDQTLGATARRKTRTVLFVLIESGMVLFSVQLARVVLSIVHTDARNNAFFIIVPIHQMLNGITPTIILVQVSMGLSFHDEKSMIESTVRSLRLAANSPNLMPEDVGIVNGDDDIGVRPSDDIEMDVTLVSTEQEWCSRGLQDEDLGTPTISFGLNSVAWTDFDHSCVDDAYLKGVAGRVVDYDYLLPLTLTSNPITHDLQIQHRDSGIGGAMLDSFLDRRSEEDTDSWISLRMMTSAMKMRTPNVWLYATQLQPTSQSAVKGTLSLLFSLQSNQNYPLRDRRKWMASPLHDPYMLSMAGITPAIILVRASMGLSFHDEKSMIESESTIESLRFAANNSDSIPETEDIGIDTQESRDDDIGVRLNTLFKIVNLPPIIEEVEMEVLIDCEKRHFKSIEWRSNATTVSSSGYYINNCIGFLALNPKKPRHRITIMLTPDLGLIEPIANNGKSTSQSSEYQHLTEVSQACTDEAA